MIHPAMIMVFRQLSTTATMCMQQFPCLILPTCPTFLIFCQQKTYLQSAFHHQLIGQSLYVSKITYDLRARKTQFYHGHRVYGPTAQKILPTLQVDSCTPEAMIQLTCFMSTWRALYVSTLLSNAYNTSTYKCRPGNWMEICQALLHSNKPKRWHVCREINQLNNVVNSQQSKMT